MLQVSEKLYITKLKTILASKYLYLLLLIAFGYVFYATKNINYEPYRHQISGTIKELKRDDDYITLTIDDVLVTYYLDNKDMNIDFDIGDKVIIEGEMSLPSNERNFYLFNYRHYLLSKKIYYTMQASSIKVISHKPNFFYQLKRYIIKHIDKYKSYNYLKTFILGDSSSLDDKVTDSYQKNGISHLFALSGMHVSLLTTIMLFLLNKIIKKRGVIYTFLFSFLIFYMALTNFSPSIIRATILFILCTLNKEFNLKIPNDHILILIFSLSLLYNPFYIYHTGFLFSYIISYSLIKFGNIFPSSHYLISLLTTSLISFISSIPIMINNSFHLNFLTPFINLIFVPLVTFIIFPLSLLTFILPCLDNIYLFLITIMENLSLSLAKGDYLTFSFHHLSLFWFIFYYIIIYFLLNKIKSHEYKYIVVLIMMLVIHYNIRYFDLYPTLSLINIGQGDAMVLTLKNNKNVLIDCGNIKSYNDNIDDSKTAKDIIIPYLESMGIHKIDYAIITHGDEDHIGSLIKVIDNIKVKNVILNKGKINNNEQKLINKLQDKNIKYYFFSQNKLTINGYLLNFINDVDTENENEDSLVIYTNINDNKILFMGDAGYETEEYLMNAYNLQDVDILKVGHHGSKYSSSTSFINLINPKVSLISVGLNNKFGHPDPNVIDKLTNVYRTDLNGSIMLILKNHQWVIKTLT